MFSLPNCRNLNIIVAENSLCRSVCCDIPQRILVCITHSSGEICWTDKNQLNVRTKGLTSFFILFFWGNFKVQARRSMAVSSTAIEMKTSSQKEWEKLVFGCMAATATHACAGHSIRTDILLIIKIIHCLSWVELLCQQVGSCAYPVTSDHWPCDRQRSVAKDRGNDQQTARTAFYFELWVETLAIQPYN